jgi:hypothetical protein
MDGLECRRCKQADAFDILCDECQEKVFGRTDKLIALSSQAKDRAEVICEKLGPDALRALAGLDDEVTEQELIEAFNRQPFTDATSSEKFFLCLHLLKLEDQREGYAELAEMSCSIFFDSNYIEDQICGSLSELARAEARQDWKNQ